MTKPQHPTLNVFAYGSNLTIQRMRDRIPAANVLDTGYVSGRKFAFHKRSIDGSAKANAMPTGCDSDRVWGVIYQISPKEREILDRHEFLGVGYDRKTVDVIAGDNTLRAFLYEARSEAIDHSLKPYCWYHRFVLHGAIQHGLPESYIDHLIRFETITDPDLSRDRQNRKLIASASSPRLRSRRGRTR